MQRQRNASSRTRQGRNHQAGRRETRPYEDRPQEIVQAYSDIPHTSGNGQFPSVIDGYSSYPPEHTVELPYPANPDDLPYSQNPQELPYPRNLDDEVPVSMPVPAPVAVLNGRPYANQVRYRRGEDRVEMLEEPEEAPREPTEAEKDILSDKELERRREIEDRVRLYGRRHCWAKHCWANQYNERLHSHPLETLDPNRHCPAAVFEAFSAIRPLTEPDSGNGLRKSVSAFVKARNQVSGYQRIHTLRIMAQSKANAVVRKSTPRRVLNKLEDKVTQIGHAVNFYGPVYKRIQGFFGSGIAGYVTLINRLLLLSFTSLLLVGGLYVVPSILNYHQYLEVLNVTGENERAILERDIFAGYAKNPQYNLTEKEIYYLADRSSMTASMLGGSPISTAALELLQGTGWLEASWLYLGQYADRLDLIAKGGNFSLLGLKNTANETDFKYLLPFAFMWSVVASMLLGLFILIFSSGSSLKENLKGRHARAYPYSEVLFSSWPHDIRVKGGVGNQKLTETSQLKILLNGSGSRTRKVRTKGEHFTLQCVRGGVWFGVAGMLAVFGYLLYMALSFWASPQEIQKLEARKNNTETDLRLEAEILFYNFLPSLVITGFNFVVPTLLELVTAFEDYSSVKVEVRITLFRTVLLRFASVAFLLVSLFEKLTLVTAPNNSTTVYAVDNSNPANEIPCFETYVGQQIYKVLLLDMLVFIATFFFLHVPRVLIFRATKIDYLRLEFDLTGNILSAIYIQCLYWLGVFYAPMLVVMALIHFFLRAILAQIGLFMIYAPPSRIHHSSGSDVFFTFVTLLSFFLSVALLGFAVIKIKPSTVCGPFLFNLNYATMYDYFMDSLYAYTGSFKWIFRYLTSSVILFPLLVLIAVILYYKVATARAQGVAVMLLKTKIEMATGQKKFLERKLRQMKAKKV